LEFEYGSFSSYEMQGKNQINSSEKILPVTIFLNKLAVREIKNAMG
jgi:hypothetical protein